MKKLFVSFTSLLYMVSQGKVSAEELDHGLFFFGCWREHAMDPNGSRMYHGKVDPSAQPLIIEAVRKAESEGRAAWHNGPKHPQRPSPWRVLNELLEANGFATLEQEPGLSWDYGYPAVREAVAAKALSLDVVY